ncbi:hypothetical protein F5Y19DRAFT_425980 [Xylariaceae sp. FL1651]|nr:hypothetical protein F5Y19DRAFT_425980 [Xylariaceae sp. FL1651]
MSEEKNKKRFSWGCTVPIDPITKFPTSATITHVRNCGCPGPDKEGVLMVILAQACYLHESNVVKYMIPVVNSIAREAAIHIGLNLTQGIENFPKYKDKVKWKNGICIEALGRGFTPEEFEELYRLPRGQSLCTWLL